MIEEMYLLQWKCASGGPKHVCVLVIRKCLQPWLTCFLAHWSVNLGSYVVSGDAVKPVNVSNVKTVSGTIDNFSLLYSFLENDTWDIRHSFK